MRKDIQYIRRNCNEAEELNEQENLKEILYHIKAIRDRAQVILDREAYVVNNKVNREEYLEFINKR